MKFYYKLSESSKRTETILAGNPRECEPITLYPETPEILREMENERVDSDWWPVWELGQPSWVPGDFPTKEDAEHAYYQAEGESIYCMMYDC